MNKHLAPIALSVGLLGVVGGVAATSAFQPVQKPAQRQVQVVQPASELVTPTGTATPVPTVTVTATPKPVQSVKAKAPAPAPVQRQATVANDPTPQTTTQVGTKTSPLPPVAPPLPPGTTVAPNGQFGPGQGTPTG